MTNIDNANGSTVNQFEGSERLTVGRQILVLRELAKTQPKSVFQAILNRDAMKRAVLVSGPVEYQAALLQYAMTGRQALVDSFNAEGEPDPSKMIQIVDYLMGHISHQAYYPKPDGNPDYTRQYQKQYLYEPEDRRLVSELSQIKDPITILDTLSEVIDFDNLKGQYLKRLVAYITFVSSHPRAIQAIQMISQNLDYSKISLGSDRSVTITDDNEGNKRISYSKHDWNWEDAIQRLSLLTAERFHLLLNEQSLQDAQQIWSDLGGGEKVSLDLLPELLRIATDSAIRSGVRELDPSNSINMELYPQALVEMVNKVEDTLQIFPEIPRLAEMGFEVRGLYLFDHGLRVDQDEDRERRIAEKKSLIAKVMDDVQLQDNARILKKHGKVMELQPSGHEHVDYVRKSTSKRLDHFLSILEVAGEFVKDADQIPIRKEEESSRNLAEYYLWQQIGLNLEAFSPDEVKKAFGRLNQGLSGRADFAIGVEALVEGVKSISELNDRINTLLDPEIIQMLSDNDFFSLVFQQSQQKKVGTLVLTNPGKYRKLYRRRDVLKKKIDMISSSNNQVYFGDFSVDTLLLICELSQEEMDAVPSTLTAEGMRISYENLRRLRLLRSLTNEEKKSILDNLNRLNFENTEVGLEVDSLFNDALPYDVLNKYVGLTEEERGKVNDVWKILQEHSDEEATMFNTGPKRLNVQMSFLFDLATNDELFASVDHFLRRVRDNSVRRYARLTSGATEVDVSKKHNFFMSQEEDPQYVLMSLRAFQNVVWPAQSDDADGLDKYIQENGAITPDFLYEYFDRAILDDELLSDAQFARRVLVDDAIAAARNDSESAFLVYFKDIPDGERERRDFVQWLVLQRENFAQYVDEQGEVRHDQLYSDFIDQMAMVPEKLMNWTTLADVFTRLTQLEPELRATRMIQIAEALTVGTLNARSEVEEIATCQASFSKLFHEPMTQKERTSWHLLRNKLPFITQENVRESMREQALVVEGHNRELLGWVHDAVHNYARAETPEYLAALIDWLRDGDRNAKEKLVGYAKFYHPYSKPPVDFFTIENRNKIAGSLSDVERLYDLALSFYRVNPQNLLDTLSENKDVLMGVSANIINQLEPMTRSLVVDSGAALTLDSCVQFLSKTGEIKQQLKALANSSRDKKQLLLQLDAMITELEHQVLPEFSRQFSSFLEQDTLDLSAADHFVRVFGSVLKSGNLEGEFSELGNSIEQLRQVDVTEQPAALHAVALNFVVGNVRSNLSWGRYIQEATVNMVETLVRMGYTESEATARVVGTDIVDFEKASYKFLLEPLIPIFFQLAEKIKNVDVERSDVLQAESSHYGVPVVADRLRELKMAYQGLDGQEMATDLQKLSQQLSQTYGASEFQAARLCRSVLPEYLDPATRLPQESAFNKNGHDYHIYPYVFHNMDGLVMTKDGVVVQDPLEEIKSLFRERITRAVLHSLREGD